MALPLGWFIWLISAVFECASVHALERRGVRETTNFTQVPPRGSCGQIVDLAWVLTHRYAT